MQIPEDLYCDECGAANQHDAPECFACHHPLQLFPASTPAIIEIKTPEISVERRFELDLATGSITSAMVSWKEVQAPTNLLHNRYEILTQVGSGGFGAVYKARDTYHRNRHVAIKAIVLDALSVSQVIEATDTFNRELSLLSDLDHSHLPHVYEHFIDPTHWYLVMDFIDGEPLDEYLRQIENSCLPLEEAVDIGLQLCDVLRYLHQCKPSIIFRDVKPENIIRTPGGSIYLIDFGIARRFKPGQAKDTAPLGSPGFAAPEQYGKAQSSTRTDLYGLGVTLYVLLTGHDPSTTPFSLPPISDFCPALPEPLIELITSMTALDPLRRPPNIAAVQHVLRNYEAIHKYAPTPVEQAHISTQSAPTGLRRISTFMKSLFSNS